MASTGAQAWVKHFKGKTVETVMKTESAVFSPLPPFAPVSGWVIEAGSKVIVKSEDVYNDKTLVIAIVKNTGQEVQCRVKFNSISKPGSKNLIKLKPKYFGVATGKALSYPDYVKILLDSIESRDLPAGVRYVIQELTMQALGKIPVRKIKLESITQTEKNIITTDYAEVIGPLFVKTFKMVPVAFDGIYQPSADNEKLYDFKLFKGETPYMFSSKAAEGGTNTLKCGDIVDIINKSPHLLNKWKNQVEYKVMLAASSNDTLNGPVKAAAEYSDSGINSQVLQKWAMIAKSKTADVASILSMFSKVTNEFPDTMEDGKKKGIIKSVVPATVIAYFCEKFLQKKSLQANSKYSEMFNDCTSGQVYFAKFKFNSDGSPHWYVEQSSDTKNKKVQIRPKNGLIRSADKIGLQP